jgi:hypothetical protein
VKIGLLWFDNDPKADLATKVQRAASYYLTKYGHPPTLCQVHPSMLPTPNPDTPFTPFTINGILLRTSRSVLPNHFWLGVSDLPGS